jgi:Na+/citrate or Na+/malate symporter
MICFVLWGMSTSLTMAITVRAIMGGGNGNGTSISDWHAYLCS